VLHKNDDTENDIDEDALDGKEKEEEEIEYSRK
jgi:hypothetical protein